MVRKKPQNTTRRGRWEGKEGRKKDTSQWVWGRLWFLGKYRERTQKNYPQPFEPSAWVWGSSPAMRLSPVTGTAFLETGCAWWTALACGLQGNLFGTARLFLQVRECSHPFYHFLCGWNWGPLLTKPHRKQWCCFKRLFLTPSMELCF